jgi:transcription elongation GreA/GreB family factor
MSRAFTREQDGDASLDLGERPVSPHRNLVSPEGLAVIDGEVARLREEFANAEAEGNRERIALASRDLRYWNARRENAELSVPEKDSDVVRFGMTVTIADEDDHEHSWKIVGEDEADASAGKISHVSPMAQALFGRAKGDLVTVNGKEWEIVGMKVE